MLVSTVIETKWFSFIYIFFQIIFHYRSLQDTEYSILCYTVNLCYLSILCIVAYIPYFLFIRSPLSFLFGNCKFVFYVYEFASTF